MKKAGVIIVICLAIGFYFFKEKRASVSEVTQNPELVFIEDPVIVDSPSVKLSSLDTTDYIRRVLQLAHDSVAKNWPNLSVIPDPGAILPFHRIVAFYGNFYTQHMGILGKLPEEEMISLLKKEAKQWSEADTLTPVIPAIHYIAITAQKSPGKGGAYRLRMPDAQIEKAISLSEKINGITFLDVQVGHSTVKIEVPSLEKYLLNPTVHLGLDPEWSMKDGSIPGKKIGSLDASDINFAIEYLSALVTKNELTPKVLVIHRFTQGMLTNYKDIKPTPQVQVVINMDGFGFPAKKVDSYRRFVGGMPVQFTGFKLFYKNDILTSPYRMMTPSEILKLYPKPIYIQYQ